MVLCGLLIFCLAAGKNSSGQTNSDQLDSLLCESLADIESTDLAEVFEQSKEMLDKARDYSFFGGRLQVVDQGRDICLISNCREHLQLFVTNYLFKPKDFSIVLCVDDKKYIFKIDKNGDGGYYTNSPDGYLVFKSLFVGNEKFRPMSTTEIFYLKERVLKLLYLIKKATD